MPSAWSITATTSTSWSGHAPSICATCVEQDALAAEHGIIFAVRSVDIQFLAPARYNDLLQVSVSRPHCGGASMAFSQTIVRGDRTLASANIRIVSLDPETLRPRRIPAFLLTECRIEQ